MIRMQNLAYQKTIIFAGRTNQYENSLKTLRGLQIPNPRPADGISAGTGAKKVVKQKHNIIKINILRYKKFVMAS